MTINNKSERNYRDKCLGWPVTSYGGVERGTFTPLVFTTTGGMSDECQRYHSRLAELLAVKKQENYTSTITWIRTRVSFAILRSALVCPRGSRSKRRTAPNIQETDLKLEVSVACR